MEGNIGVSSATMPNVTVKEPNLFIRKTTPFVVTLSCEINFDIKFSEQIKSPLPSLSEKGKKMIIQGLERVNSIYPSLLSVESSSPTSLIILPGFPNPDFFDDYDASFIDKENGIKVSRMNAYIHESTINANQNLDLSSFVLYDLLSKSSWGNASDVPFGMDFGTRHFLTNAFNHHFNKTHTKTNWLNEEVVAGFFASILGRDKFVRAFSNSDPTILKEEIFERTKDETTYSRLCVFKHKELMQFIFFIITEPKNNFVEVKDFLLFGEKNGYDFSRLFELLADMPKYKGVLGGDENIRNG
ncbi:hypothetical protein KO465_02510 [Candidatus Micrarchaeota archaeon]|jgi:hypothetical protein|nr:hypothetical protein [Candidatus Micrarchaeota archaeon]